MSANLSAIYIAPDAAVPMRAVSHARAVPGRGLEGDRYAFGTGTFSARPGIRDITLVEAESLEEFARDYGQAYDPALSRRNLLTRGVRLNDLVHCEFMVGEIVLRGLRLCEPCTHLARLTSLPVLPGLIQRGGLYAEIVRGGEFVIGDAIKASSIRQ